MPIEYSLQIIIHIVPCRVPVKTPLEIASSGLRLNKTKKLALCWKAGKGRGVTTQEPIKAGEYVCEYKYSTCYPLRERKEWDKAYECNSEGCYVLEVVARGGGGGEVVPRCHGEPQQLRAVYQPYRTMKGKLEDVTHPPPPP